MRQIHCSDLPRLMSCPASAQPPEVVFADTGSEASRLGTAVHSLLAASAQGFSAKVTEVADENRVDPQECGVLYHMGNRMLRRYLDSIKLLAVEHPFSAPLDKDTDLVGTGDLIGEVLDAPEPTVLVIDYKTGRCDRDYRDQLCGYGWLAKSDWPEIEVVKSAIAWVRDQAVEIEDLTADDLVKWRARLDDALKHPNRYNPTPENCEFCARAHECPARSALVQRAMIDFMPTAQMKAAPPAPAHLGKLYDQSKMLKAALDAYDQALRATVAEHGPVPTGDGREIALVEGSNRHLDVGGVIEKLGLEKALPALKASVKAVSGIVRADAPARQKGKTEQAFFTALEDEGMLTRTAFTKIRVRRVAKQLEEGEDDG